MFLFQTTETTILFYPSQSTHYYGICACTVCVLSCDHTMLSDVMMGTSYKDSYLHFCILSRLSVWPYTCVYCLDLVSGLIPVCTV